MKLQFDANQQYQLDAISTVVNIFKGQPLNKGDFEIEFSRPLGQLQFKDNLVIANNLLISHDTLLKNVRDVQKENDLDESDKLDGLNFSIEMETGTGKTYVYLRTIHELYKRYGFKKFIIVVPGIAIKEGVLKNLEITKEHFALLYENPEMDFAVYDPRKRGLLKSFATTNTLQILVINIDSFAKFSDEKAGKNVIYQNSDWGIPIEYLQGVQPIVIVDEPQNMETEIRRQAIANLNPLCTLRYSATHKYHYNLIYKLDPVKAYDLGLVKKIEVDSVLAQNSYNAAYVELKSVKAKKMTITASVRIDVAGKDGVQKKDLTVRVGDDLYKLSGQRDLYKDGFVINEMDAENQSITFSNSQTLRAGESQGGLTDEIMRTQINTTVANHFEKERILRPRGIKVLSLFFIDRVANYRNYDTATASKGKLALWFEEAFNRAIQNPEYKQLVPFAVEKVHNGYFSQDKQGALKDTQGNTRADDDTYALIMKDKEKLLSLDEPLRFIFSHSALREGWDNPNVFQICTLNETKSEIKKRQEIGRGLRLPVDQNGLRVFDQNQNILTVIANESYDDFARSLQTEIEEECGVNFSGRIKDKRQRRDINLKKGYQLDENFKDLWERIKHKTRYQVNYDTQELIKKAAKELAEAEIKETKIVNAKASLNISKEGVVANIKRSKEAPLAFNIRKVPDFLGYIQNKTKLTKDTISKIILASGGVGDILKNPQHFMDVASQVINQALNTMMIDGIKYDKIANGFWEMKEFENEELAGYLENMVQVKNQEKTLYDYILVDSGVEESFAKDLESREDVKFYFKLPFWFKIETPIGSYNPDWAIVFEGDKRVYFVAETKGKDQELRESEKMKIHCGKKHFENFPDVNFKAPISNVKEIDVS
ncbi:MAG: DEAD/DEAH box helicase family protein [Veillonellaceae bacterium]|nr:DEAD/DEAH box helicase family protein [Veillonellaceae bacterium]